jgi:hypothetical protein
VIRIKRMLWLMVAIAGCGKVTSTGSTPATVKPSPAPTSTVEDVQLAAAPQVASPTRIVSTPDNEPPKAATDEFGSRAAMAHPDQAKAMLAAAQRTWEATKASYDVGTSTLESLHRWSKELLLAERAMAETKQQDLAALEAYWKRSKQIYLKVRALYTTGTRGGEVEKFGAASFYLAEAELWLLDAGGTIPDELDE